MNFAYSRSICVVLWLQLLLWTARAWAAPEVLFVDVESGPVTGGPNNEGAPISIFGRGFGAARGQSRVTIGGVAVSSYWVWGERNAANAALDMIVVQPGPLVTGGAIVVTVAGSASNSNYQFTKTNSKIHAIATTGSDSASCTMSLPCATIQHVAGNVAAPGDILLMRGGNYSESEVWLRADYNQSGAAGLQKVIKAYPGEVVNLTNAARPFILDANYITVSGLNFKNGKSIGLPDIPLPGRRGARLINNSFRGVVAWDAIGVHGDNHVLAGNDCSVSGSTVGTQGHCFYVSYGDGNQLRYNVGSGAPGYGIHVFDQNRVPSNKAADFRRVISNLLIEGNFLKSSTLRSGLIIAMEDEGAKGNRIDNVTIRGNTFTANNHLGAVIGGSAPVTNVSFSGNEFYQNGRQGVHIEGARIDGVTVTRNSFTQSNGNACTSDCSWYPVAHIELKGTARNVVVNSNYYTESRVTLGVQDTAPLPSTPLGPRLYALPIGSSSPPNSGGGGSTPPNNGGGGSSTGACANGPITGACSCGGATRTSDFCCNGQWFSYDACKVAGGTQSGTACPNGAITSACVCGGSLRTSDFCCNGSWHSYDACQVTPRRIQ